MYSTIKTLSSCYAGHEATILMLSGHGNDKYKKDNDDNAIITMHLTKMSI